MDSQTATTFGGIDWATDDHAVCVVDYAGDIVEELVVPHTSVGLRRLCAVLHNHSVARVAIERPDGPVVDALMSESIDVVVVPSRSVKAFRQRYALSGTKSDRGDAYVLADCLRSDGHRWSSLQPDTPATVTLRQHVRARRDLVDTRVAVANQLRAHLAINFPGVVGLFSNIDGQTSRRFLRRFPTPVTGSPRSASRTGFDQPATTHVAAPQISTPTSPLRRQGREGPTGTNAPR
jgi:transposase